MSSNAMLVMLPNMFVVMGLTMLIVFLGSRIDHKLLTLVMILISSALAALSYKRVLRLAEG